MMRVELDGATSTAQAADDIFQRQGFDIGGMVSSAPVSVSSVNKAQEQRAHNASQAAVVHLARYKTAELKGVSNLEAPRQLQN
jgi:NAD(P)-dependent dehydrogenase (short-subunit alcohol dehydrogenase family)